MNQRNHEAWKQIFIRDQWDFEELREEYKVEHFKAVDNDSAHVICIGS